MPLIFENRTDDLLIRVSNDGDLEIQPADDSPRRLVDAEDVPEFIDWLQNEIAKMKMRWPVEANTDGDRDG